MDNEPLMKRPKATDSEEELFRMQEEFLQNRQTPSAKVINLRGNASAQPIKATSSTQPERGKIKSRFSELKKLRNQERVSTSQASGNIVNPNIKEGIGCKNPRKKEDSVYNLESMPSNIILGNIVEKVYTDNNYQFKPSGNIVPCAETGFPEVFTSDHLNQKTDDQHSLFWHYISQLKSTDDNVSELQKNEDVSAVVHGSWATEIHKENLKKLSQMSQEEILQEKSKLEMTLDPNIIQFLKNMRYKDHSGKTQESQQSQQSEVSLHQDDDEPMEQERTTEKGKLELETSAPMDVDKEKKNLPEPPREILQQAKEQGWVHMDSVEPEKLKWMENVSTNSTTEHTFNEPYNARFDFNGLLLPYKDDSVPIEKGLHHHGEEPERPGYSLQELLQLSRSLTQQQRCTALTTIANILEKSRKGWYDKALQPSPLTALNERNILLLLRFSLDDSSVAIVTATLQAFRALLYSEADEVCLDRLYGFDNYTEPILIPQKNDVNDTSNLKDHELAQLDAIAALCRTDIFVRIRYLLNHIRPPPIGVNCAMEILIRLIRRSQVTALEIARTPHLLETIVQNFIPLSTDPLAKREKIDNAYGVPIVAAVRFCRILTCYGGKIVAEKLDSLKIVQSIISYISCDAGKLGVNLSIESLRLWKILLLHDVAKDSIVGAQLILLSQLQLLLSNHDIQNASELSCEYAATLITVANYQPLLKTNISVLLSKWNTQLHLLSSPTWGNTKLIAETLLAVKGTAAIKALSLSKTQVLSKLCSSSNLLSTCVPANDREPSSLPNLGVLTHEGQLQPSVSHESCIPFLSTVFRVFMEAQCTSEIEWLLEQPELHRYLKQLEVADWSLERSWYTRMELLLLTAIVQSAFVIEKKVDSKIMQVIWKIALKLVSALPADEPSSVRDMLRLALSKERLNVELATNKLANLNLDSSGNDMNLNVSYNVSPLYERFLPLNGDWDQAAMPKDWLYLPVVHIYTKCKNDGKCNDSDRNAILTLLSLEFCLPDLVGQLSESLRFSRLVLVYLCDTIYLSKDVSVLLTTVMSNLLKQHHKRFNFATNVPGLNSFTDLFTAMCEHFCSTSYGDYGFSMTLLVPLAQRRDAHYRKLLWSEHAGALRYIRLPIEKLIIPLKEYLYPLEEDVSLIESYMTALVRNTIRQEWCPILYKIAVHHSAMYLKQSSKLAVRMRSQMEKLPNKNLVDMLLNYEPSLNV